MHLMTSKFTLGIEKFVRQAYLLKQNFELKKILAYNEKFPVNIKKNAQRTKFFTQRVNRAWCIFMDFVSVMLLVM